jgi:hypothetical protein
MSEYEIKNAVIESATLTTADIGLLTAYVYLDYGVSGQGFGGYALYLPKSFANSRIETIAGHFIYRVMEIAGVQRWEDLKGKTIRVKSDFSSIYAIGHIVKDDWFSPSEEYKTLAQKHIDNLK